MKAVRRKYQLDNNTRRLFAAEGQNTIGATEFTVDWLLPETREDALAELKRIRSNPDHGYNRPHAPSHQVCVAHVRDLYRMIYE